MSRAGVYWDGVYWHSREPVKSVSWPAPDPAERRWPVYYHGEKEKAIQFHLCRHHWWSPSHGLTIWLP